MQCFAAGVCVAVVTAASVVVMQDVAERQSAETEAATLPSACENLVQAAAVIAKDGSSVASADPGVFSADAAEGPSETLSTLVDSCDQELARSP